MKIGMTSVFVKNVEDAFTFYTETLGFVEHMHLPEANLAIVVSAEQPDGTALLLEPNDHPAAKTYQDALHNEGLPVIVFSVDDLEAEYRRLKELGVRFKDEPMTTEAGQFAVFDDTCGNFIQLHQP